VKPEFVVLLPPRPIISVKFWTVLIGVSVRVMRRWILMRGVSVEDGKMGER